MRRVSVFNNVSIDGYFTDADANMSFAHNQVPDPDWDAFVASNAGGNETLLFGRVTYQMMESFWTTPKAAELLPKIAEGMNRLRKLVFSRTLKSVAWSGATLAKGEPVDAYQLAVAPVVLGKGRTMFDGLPRRLPLKLKASRAFRNGNVLLTYEAV